MARTSSDYMSGPHDSEKCGCRHNGSEWTNRCAAATANDRAMAAAWAADHVRLNPNIQFTAEYLALAAEAGKSQQPYSNNEDLR